MPKYINTVRRQLPFILEEAENELTSLGRELFTDLYKQLIELDKKGFSVFQFPPNYWRKLRTTNPLARVNREIKRRTQVVSIFPNISSCERLISALSIGISEEWMSEPTYMLMENSKIVH